MTDQFKHTLALLAEKKNLPREQAVRAFQIIMNGGATPAQMAAFLMGLRIKGETVDELVAGAEVLRVKALAIQAPADCIDTCGTGGDSRGTYNISTTVALVLAACGLPVAKHGNRSVTSRCGSADVLAELGVKIDAPVAVLERCLRECSIAFLMAPQFHPAMRHVAPVRQELGLRTVFNLLGPLANPARPAFQLVGVFAAQWLEPVAQALAALGVQRAWVVHGSDGQDELSLSGESQVVALEHGALRRFTLTAADAGLSPAPLEALRGGDAAENAAALRQALSGMESTYRDAVLLNAAAALVIAGRAPTLSDGVAQAREAIDSGRAYATLQKLVLISNEPLHTGK
jgi:anthranilate phosphoribosyltransferase